MLEACGGHGGQNRDILRACNATTKPRALLWLSLASYVCHASMHIRHEYQALLRLAIKIPGKTFLILYNCSLIFHKSTTHKYIYLLLRLKQLTHRSWHWLLFGEGLVLLSCSLKWHCYIVLMYIVMMLFQCKQWCQKYVSKTYVSTRNWI